jgi:hypothetical protein
MLLWLLQRYDLRLRYMLAGWQLLTVPLTAPIIPLRACTMMTRIEDAGTEVAPMLCTAMLSAQPFVTQVMHLASCKAQLNWMKSIVLCTS